jgi:phosphatidate cytidylyltransferase
MFIKRLSAAIVGVPLLVALFTLGSPLLVFIIFTIAVLIAQSEYASMVYFKDAISRMAVILLGGILFVTWGLATIYQADAWVLHLALFSCVASMFIFFLMRPGEMATIGNRLALGVLGMVYVPLMSAYLVGIHNLDDNGGLYLLTFFAIVWLNDTGAYFAGKSLGKRKLYKLVSPNKTWEGAVGGLAAGIIGAFVFSWALGFGWSALHTFGLAVGAGVIGQVGDLCESLLKRSFGIKDSGQIIPGHGGVLDRIDAILFAAPFTYYFLRLVILLKGV